MQEFGDSVVLKSIVSKAYKRADVERKQSDQ